ncbi:GPW/gp25 family protein [Arthrobacter antioxidans]|uniref:GPW/gp25 family protein n=1 Tax=Arthrobacter antioxidans TaxID=2895818 RepID=UPI001FFF929C|nr:GPW/gp25 family protein [Arthrobacter antioxidans]
MDSRLDYPFTVDRRGRTATTDKSDHLQDMIHAVLFTRPGERVNRPDFGCGLAALLFQPNTTVLAGETRLQVMSALQRWLATAITVERVEVQAAEERLVVTIEYIRLDTGQRVTDTFQAG